MLFIPVLTGDKNFHLAYLNCLETIAESHKMHYKFIHSVHTFRTETQLVSKTDKV
jgi:hypothetical protein